MSETREELIARIEDNYIPEPNSGCYLWELGAVGGGYGAIWHEERMQPVHRVYYELIKGPIPDGLMLRHKCDVRLCGNLDHLLTGTHQDNMDDRSNRNRQPKGEAHGRAFLSDEIIEEIRIAEGYHREIAERFGVSRTHVTNIKLGYRRSK